MSAIGFNLLGDGLRESLDPAADERPSSARTR